jgi:hypothetical protein
MQSAAPRPKQLLRQPGGLTGLDSVREPLQAKDLPVPDRGDAPLIELDLGAAPRSARVVSQMDQDFVGSGSNALDLYRDPTRSCRGSSC